MVGEADRERSGSAKIGASSGPEEGSRADARSGRAGEAEREGGFRVGRRGDARELGGRPGCAENWPFFFRDGRDFGGGMQLAFLCLFYEFEKKKKKKKNEG